MLRRSGHFYPPAHLLPAPLPGFLLQSPGALCLPCTQYEVAGDALRYHSFFVALKLPAWPDTLQIESLCLFTARPARAFLEAWREIEQLAREYHCRHLLLRLVESQGPLFFPSTGFWTSPANSPGLDSLVRQAGWPHQASFTIWEIAGETQQQPEPYTWEMQPAFPPAETIRHWHQCRFRLSLASGDGSSRAQFSLIPDLTQDIAHYGKLPPLIRWRSFSQVRLQLEAGDEAGAEPLVPALRDWLGRQGILTAQLGNIPASRPRWLKALGRGGRLVATMREYIREAVD